MLEVIPIGNRWTWRWVCARGRVLVYCPDSFETDYQAHEAAKQYRRTFWAHAAAVDHRMGACV